MKTVTFNQTTVTRTLIGAYLFFGLFAALHQDAWERHCQRPWPLIRGVETALLWPFWMGIVIVTDLPADDSFICR